MATITVLVNNTGDNEFQTEHGLSFWIEYNSKHVLFDTGQTDIITNNASKMGVDLANTDAVILSHGHYDHTGGIPSVFAIAQRTCLYMHPKALDPRYSRKPERTRAIGMPKASRQVIYSIESEGKVVRTEKPSEIFPGLYVTGTIPRKTNFENTGGNFFHDQRCTVSDETIDDQAVYFKTEKGIVVLLGCGHSGVINTLDYVSSLTGQKHIYGIIGGMHLLEACCERIYLTIEAIKRYKVQQLGLAHCTGSNAIKQLRNAFPEQSFECLAGIQRTF